MSARGRFAEVVREAKVRLDLACLLLGAEADPAVDVDAGLASLDALAARVDASVAPVEALRRVLHDFHGDAADYEDLRSSLLHEVLPRRRGLPILLSVVWLEVARRAGVPAMGVGLPGHFVVRVGAPAVLVDPFRGGADFPTAEVARLLGGPPDAADLRGWAAPEILLRILANIRVWAADRPDRLRTRLWAVELSLLLPAHPAGLRREHGELLGRTGRFVAGAEELEAYADGVDLAHPVAAAGARQEARMLRARLN